MTAEKMEEFSFVLTEEFQKVVGFSAEELASWFLADTVDRIKATECAMRLLYPSEGLIFRQSRDGLNILTIPYLPISPRIRSIIRTAIIQR